jgi:hypothetical protein
MNELLLKHYMYKDLEIRGKDFYKEYNREIQLIVPNERLVMNVKEGWEPVQVFREDAEVSVCK